jgi:hypothetical protein
MNIHKIRPRPLAAVQDAVAQENKTASETKFGGGGSGHKNDAVVVENVDNGYIVRVICSALERETVMVFSHEQRGDLLHYLASVI